MHTRILVIVAFLMTIAVSAQSQKLRVPSTLTKGLTSGKVARWTKSKKSPLKSVSSLIPPSVKPTQRTNIIHPELYTSCDMPRYTGTTPRNLENNKNWRQKAYEPIAPNYPSNAQASKYTPVIKYQKFNTTGNDKRYNFDDRYELDELLNDLLDSTSSTRRFFKMVYDDGADRLSRDSSYLFKTWSCSSEFKLQERNMWSFYDVNRSMLSNPFFLSNRETTYFPIHFTFTSPYISEEPLIYSASHSIEKDLGALDVETYAKERLEIGEAPELIESRADTTEISLSRPFLQDVMGISKWKEKGYMW